MSVVDPKFVLPHGPWLWGSLDFPTQPPLGACASQKIFFVGILRVDPGASITRPRLLGSGEVALWKAYCTLNRGHEDISTSRLRIKNYRRWNSSHRTSRLRIKPDEMAFKRQHMVTAHRQGTCIVGSQEGGRIDSVVMPRKRHLRISHP